MLVKFMLERDANNLDLIRIIAACMVIYGHAYSIAPEVGRSDFIQDILGFDYTGSLAVKIFFFISGLVVTNSLLVKRNALSFLISRVFRIWPAFMFVVLSCAFVIGPIYTDYTLGDYFHSPQFSVVDYVVSNFRLDIRYYLPGVFFELPYEAAVNGSLWTLFYEVAAYLMLLLFYMGGLLRDRFVGSLSLGLSILMLHFIQPDGMHAVWHQPFLMQCFAFGALLALNKDFFNLHIGVLVLAWSAYVAGADSSAERYFLYIAIFLTLLYISSLKLMLRLKAPVDISYGVYLWGFPVQQMMAYHFLDWGVRFNQITSLILCIILGLISWYFVEARCIRYGTQFSRFLNKKLFPNSGKDMVSGR